MSRRNSRQRDASRRIANEELARLLRLPDPVPVTPIGIEENFTGDTLPHDRRLFHFGEPEQYTLAAALGAGDYSDPVISPGRPLDIGAFNGISRSPRRAVSVPQGVQFGSPETVAICVRRRTRREVLHALRRVGKGSRVRTRRRRWYSDIRC